MIETPTPDPPHPDRTGMLPGWAWPCLAVAAAGADLSRHLFRGWIPHDEGAMALAAAFVRAGRWPHRDFADVYTGGLALLDAGAQALFGNDLRALRLPFAAATLLWVVILAACLRRFTSAPAAAALALLAYLWGPPLYTAPLPSWYLLFLATTVLWCLMRWHETGKDRWWWGIGLCGGLGILLKINALFIVAGAGSVLLVAPAPEPPTAAGAPARPLVSAWPAAILLMIVAAAGWVVFKGWGVVDESLLLITPLVALGTAALWHGWRTPPAPLRTTLRRALLLAAGVLLVVGPWAGAYALTGGWHALVEGVFVVPFRRIGAAQALPILPWLGLAAGIVPMLLFRTMGWTERRIGIARRIIIISTGALLLLSLVWRDQPVQLVWTAARAAAAFAIVLVAWGGAGPADPAPVPLRAAAWLAAWVALIQFPFAAPIYFAYVIPLYLVVGVGLLQWRGVPPRVSGAIAAGLAALTLVLNHGQTLLSLGFAYASLPPMVPLGLPHTGIEVPLPMAKDYQAIVATLDRWNARVIVAAPDSPEIYYLSGRPLLDREFFEFMAPEWGAAELRRRIIAHRADAAVLNLRPGFSQVAIDSVVQGLPARPSADTIIGRFLLLRLTPPAPAP